MDIDDFEEEESSTENEAPIGVYIDMVAVVDTGHYTTALDVASQVAREMEENTESPDVEVQSHGTAGTFNPEE